MKAKPLPSDRELLLMLLREVNRVIEAWEPLLFRLQVCTEQEADAVDGKAALSEEDRNLLVKMHEVNTTTLANIDPPPTHLLAYLDPPPEPKDVAAEEKAAPSVSHEENKADRWLQASFVYALLEKALVPYNDLRDRLMERIDSTTNAPLSAENQSALQGGEGCDAPEKSGISVQGKSLKQPSDDALKAYRLYILKGENQTETARLLTQELHHPIHQGTVSRWITQVKEWLAAGNVLPKLLDPLKEKPEAMDPKFLDQGERLDHRAKHQREEKKED